MNDRTMKKLVIPAFVLALAAGAPAIAWAQNDEHHDTDTHQAMPGQGDESKPDKNRHDDKTKTKPGDQGGSQGTNHGGDQGGTGDHNATGGGNTMSGPNAMSGAEKNTRKHEDERDRTRELNRTSTMHNATGTNDRDHNSDRDRNKDRGGVHANIHIDLGNYRRTVSASHHFRIGVYHAPRGYAYRRWTLGARLPPEYFVRDYWLTDFAAYDLVAPPDGYVWVRFGPDALLIDEDTGEVIQVVYGVFI
ncbi:MAG: RcnB family protein [Rhizomicrobium sp.]